MKLGSKAQELRTFDRPVTKDVTLALLLIRSKQAQNISIFCA